MVQRLFLCVCQRKGCNHAWLSFSELVPLRCARCKNPSWNKDIGEKEEKVARQSTAIAAPIEKQSKKEAPAPAVKKKEKRSAGKVERCPHGFFSINGVSACVKCG